MSLLVFLLFILRYKKQTNINNDLITFQFLLFITNFIFRMLHLFTVTFYWVCHLSFNAYVKVISVITEKPSKIDY